MKTIYLIRHGESEINVSDTFMDDMSPPLTELGRAQSEFLAKRAKKLSFDALIASPFARTRETAELVAKETGHSIEISALFGERTLPRSLVGKRKSDPEAKALAERAVRSSETGEERVEGTETFWEMKERAGAALKFLEERPEEHILVVSHGFFSRMLVARTIYGEHFTPKEFGPLVWGLRTKNTGISVLKYDQNDRHGPWWMLVWNDHAHLG